MGKWLVFIVMFTDGKELSVSGIENVPINLTVNSGTDGVGIVWAHVGLTIIRLNLR